MALARRKLWDQSRRIYTEEKAKVRASYFARGGYEEKEELHQDDMKKRRNSSYSSNRLQIEDDFLAE